MRSVPPRGSGWVSLALGLCVMSRPTRYREVVLTSWVRTIGDRPLKVSD
jgi:hypothetical protein